LHFNKKFVKKGEGHMKELEKDKPYFVAYKSFTTGKISQTRKPWIFMGTQKGGIFDILYYVFSRDTYKTLRRMAIPEYCLKVVQEYPFERRSKCQL